MKRLSFALIILGLSIHSLASLPAATDPVLIDTLQSPGGFYFGIAGFYWQPSNQQGDMGYSVISPANSVFNTRSVEPNYDWGWSANIGYTFPDGGNDYDISYLDFGSNDTNAITIPATQLITPIDINDDILGTINNSYARAEYNIEQVDVTGGQAINVGCRVRLHPLLGLRWTGFERKLNRTFIDESDNWAQIQERSTFSGLGPLAGLDASYYLTRGFGIVTHLDSALLAGNIKDRVLAASFNSTDQSVSLTELNSSNTTSNATRLAVIADAKLGADYTYVISKKSKADLTLEAGWQVSKYFNTVDKMQGGIGSQGGGGSESSVITRRFTSNVGFQGPYLSLMYHG